MLHHKSRKNRDDTIDDRTAARVANYARAMTTHELDLQLSQLEAEAKRLGRDIVEEYRFLQTAASPGATENIDCLFGDIPSDKFDILQVCDLGRFGDDDRILDLLNICEHHGVSVHMPVFGAVTKFHIFALMLASRLKGGSA